MKDRNGVKYQTGQKVVDTDHPEAARDGEVVGVAKTCIYVVWTKAGSIKKPKPEKIEEPEKLQIII